MKEPKIRFKGFEGEWEKVKLGDVGIFKSNGVDKTIHNNEKIVNLLNYLDVYNARLVTKNNCHQLMHVSASDRQIKECDIQMNDVFFTPSSETAEDIGHVLVIKETLPNTCYSYHLLRYRPNKGIFYGDFPNYGFATKFVRSQMRLLAKGVQRYVIGKSEFESIVVQIPSISEQQSIASYFQHLDSLIQSTTKKIESLKQVKAASLQSMFPQEGETTPRVRFKGFEGEWSICPLKYFAKKSTEKNISMDYTITLTNSAEYGVINQRDFFDHDISNDDHINGYYVIHHDDFVYNPRVSTAAPVGPISRNRLGYSGVMSPLYLIFRVNGINKDFLSYYFKTTLWHNYMKLEGNTGARFDRLAISDEQFFNMPIYYPKDEEEQTAIASYFTNLDRQITLHTQRLEKLKQIKSACLDNMFV